MTTPEMTLPPCSYCGPTCEFGYGYCHCGCMGKTTIQTRNRHYRGLRTGFPARFMSKHGPIRRLKTEDAVPFKIEGVYCRLIPLTKGYYAIVWESDYEWLMQWKWGTRKDNRGHIYAIRLVYVGPGRTYRSVRMHRILVDVPEGAPVDHRSGVCLDNRRSNLRPATRSKNSMNAKKRSDNTSGYKGVCFHRSSGRWRATITKDGVRYPLGGFGSPELAFEAYKAAALRLFGEFARW